MKLKVAVLIIIAGFAYSGYRFYQFESTEVQALEAERKAIEKSITTKQNELKRLQNFAENIEQIKQELRELNLKLQVALEHMPRTFDLPALLRKLANLAHNSGVELVDFTPGTGEQKAPDSFYATTDIKFRIRGSFPQSLHFFDQLTRMKRIVSIKTLDMKPTARVGSGRWRGAQVTAETDASILTYRFAE